MTILLPAIKFKVIFVGNKAWGMGHGAWGIGHWALGMGHWAYLTTLENRDITFNVKLSSRF